ncbi:unnamed protein product, partial [Protopolystoma xenopodis]
QGCRANHGILVVCTSGGASTSTGSVIGHESGAGLQSTSGSGYRSVESAGNPNIRSSSMVSSATASASTGNDPISSASLLNSPSRTSLPTTGATPAPKKKYFYEVIVRELLPGPLNDPESAPGLRVGWAGETACLSPLGADRAGFACYFSTIHPTSPAASVLTVDYAFSQASTIVGLCPDSITSGMAASGAGQVISGLSRSGSPACSGSCPASGSASGSGGGCSESRSEGGSGGARGRHGDQHSWNRQIAPLHASEVALPFHPHLQATVAAAASASAAISTVATSPVETQMTGLARRHGQVARPSGRSRSDREKVLVSGSGFSGPLWSTCGGTISAGTSVGSSALSGIGAFGHPSSASGIGGSSSNGPTSVTAPAASQRPHGPMVLGGNSKIVHAGGQIIYGESRSRPITTSDMFIFHKGCALLANLPWCRHTCCLPCSPPFRVADPALVSCSDLPHGPVGPFLIFLVCELDTLTTRLHCHEFSRVTGPM